MIYTITAIAVIGAIAWFLHSRRIVDLYKQLDNVLEIAGNAAKDAIKATGATGVAHNTKAADGIEFITTDQHDFRMSVFEARIKRVESRLVELEAAKRYAALTHLPPHSSNDAAKGAAKDATAELPKPGAFAI